MTGLNPFPPYVHWYFLPLKACAQKFKGSVRATIKGNDQYRAETVCKKPVNILQGMLIPDPGVCCGFYRKEVRPSCEICRAQPVCEAPLLTIGGQFRTLNSRTQSPRG